MLFAVCRLPNEDNGPSTSQVTINGFVAAYTRICRRPEFSKLPSKRNLKHLKTALGAYYDGDFVSGVSIEIPNECLSYIDEQRVLKVFIPIRVVRPQHVRFFLLSSKDTSRFFANIIF